MLLETWFIERGNMVKILSVAAFQFTFKLEITRSIIGVKGGGMNHNYWNLFLHQEVHYICVQMLLKSQQYLYVV